MTGESRLDNSCWRWCQPANVTPHRPEDHEWGVKTLAELGVGDGRSHAQRHLARFDGWLKNEASQARERLVRALQIVEPGFLHDHDAERATIDMATALAFVHQIILELEQEAGGAIDELV